MGQGSRGGNGGISSSGTRQRPDKESKSPIIINNKNSNSNSAQGGKGGKGGRRGFPNGNFPNGVPNLGLPHLGGNSSGNKKGSGNKAAKKTAPPPAQKQNKLKKITRIKPVRVKLTKQRTNKTPN